MKPLYGIAYCETHDHVWIEGEPRCDGTTADNDCFERPLWWGDPDNIAEQAAPDGLFGSTYDEAFSFGWRACMERVFGTVNSYEWLISTLTEQETL